MFRRMLGVYPETYAAMLGVMKEREANKKRSGRPAALELEEQLVLTLEFWREYRSHEHLAMEWEVDESTVRRTIRRVEDTLIGSGAFKLPGRKKLRQEMSFEVVVVDVAESPIERPKKSSEPTTRGRKSGIP